MSYTTPRGSGRLGRINLWSGSGEATIMGSVKEPRTFLAVPVAAGLRAARQQTRLLGTAVRQQLS
jgi:hypothetical protein